MGTERYECNNPLTLFGQLGSTVSGSQTVLLDISVYRFEESVVAARVRKIQEFTIPERKQFFARAIT